MFVIYLTAGSAKNAMPNTQKQEATIFPHHVLGTLSPFYRIKFFTFLTLLFLSKSIFYRIQSLQQ